MKDKLKELLKKYSKAELALKIGVSETTVYRWLRGSVPHKIIEKRIDNLYKRSF